MARPERHAAAFDALFESARDAMTDTCATGLALAATMLPDGADDAFMAEQAERLASEMLTKAREMLAAMEGGEAHFG